MKPKRLVLALVLIVLSLLTGCSPIISDIPDTKTVYATFYPIYSLTKMIADGADDLKVRCLVQPQDDCLRSYELSDWDLYMLAYSADAIIAGGCGLEAFSDKLEEMGRHALPVAEVMPGLELYQNGETTDEDSHFSGTNPHLYMSLEGTAQLIEAIDGTLSLLIPEKAEVFKQNAVCITDELQSISTEVQKQTEVCTGISAAVLHENLFYTAKDCRLSVVAWYERESGEMLYGSAMEYCLRTLREQNVQIVLLENQAPTALIDAIEAEGYTAVRLNIMSTLSENDDARTPLDILRDNALTIANACRSLH